MTSTLVLGGARSGKSRYAEQLLRGREGVMYVAPGPVPTATTPSGPARGGTPRPAPRVVADRRDRRPRRRPARRHGTGPRRLPGDLAHRRRRPDDAWDDRERASACVGARTRELLDAWSGATVAVVAVTNEVGMAVVPATTSGRLFRDELGRLNAVVSAASDRVVLVVAGRVLDLSGCPVVEP